MAKKDESVDAKNFNSTLDKFSDDKHNAAFENLRTALANLGLKIIDDTKRVHKPEEIYNAIKTAPLQTERGRAKINKIVAACQKNHRQIKFFGCIRRGKFTNLEEEFFMSVYVARSI